ncbi:hypothetical protein FLL45_08585 [Aliikangiella marina]|uniref:STAS/SEC14 domain-containing protein n=1 Tax=Aliikangiella marina TaxID=1712262 RepID=A0A545TCQ4_9GAMM|nr:hypothetical protein [Aliikangiella marina]TQV74989.1 hypothetical protein FLL45_08585 [Aliikangiella marina]
MKTFQDSDRDSLFSAVDIKFDKQANYADMSYRGAITLTCLNDSFEKLVKHPQFDFNMNTLADFTDAYPEIEMPGIESHAQFVQERLSVRGSTYKLAMVTNDTLGTALLSVYKLLMARTSIEIEVFSRKVQAVRWLLED